MQKNNELRFLFGQNWDNFIKYHFSAERVEISKDKILDFLELETLEGYNVLDVGSGSGLHSLAMLRAEANSVTSFDYDKKSVATTSYLANRYGGPGWDIKHGSVLDKSFLAKLPTYKLVYSWGVLHHTGNVWAALENVAKKVEKGGLLFIALYSKNALKEEPEFWLNIKKKYNTGSDLKKRFLELWYIAKFELGYNPLRILKFLKNCRSYKAQRGMSKLIDIRDWLGGWPMEFVDDMQTVDYLENKGLKLLKMKTGEANTEFLFRRVSFKDPG